MSNSSGGISRLFTVTAESGDGIKLQLYLEECGACLVRLEKQLSVFIPAAGKNNSLKELFSLKEKSRDLFP